MGICSENLQIFFSQMRNENFVKNNKCEISMKNKQKLKEKKILCYIIDIET